MKYLAILSVFLGLSNVTLSGQDSLPSILPNVILIVVDDLGWNDVGYHGSEIQTPTIDRLVSEGVELNRFYVHSTCSPTRSSLMTGKTAIRLGFINPLGKNNVLGLPLSEKIMPQYFKEEAYATYLVGKWHLGRYKKEYWPNNRGFDHFYGYLTGGIGHYDHVHGGGLDWQRNGKTIEEQGYSTHLLTEEAIKIIESNQEQPFFLELCYAAPHMPNEAPNEAISAYEHMENENRQVHAAMVSEVDKGIQYIIHSLEETGQLEHTILWFMSDNGAQNFAGTPKEIAGPIMKIGKIWGKPLPFPFLEFLRDNMVNGAGDNRPLKGGKATVYEGGLRVPSFIYAPRYLQKQKVNHRVTVNDVLPTLVEAIGKEALNPDSIDGVNQWLFLKQVAIAPQNTFVSVSKWGQAYYKENWKLVLPQKDLPELYKIMEDSLEQKNLAGEFPEVVAELKAELLSFPRGAKVDDPLWKVFLDTDTFGGQIDRIPYAGAEGKVSGPLHYSIYIAGIIIFTFIVLLVTFLRQLIRVFYRK